MHLACSGSSRTPIEQQHIIDAFSFELGKSPARIFGSGWSIPVLACDVTLAEGVAHNLGFALTHEQTQIAPPPDVNDCEKRSALSLYAVPDGVLKSRVVAITAERARLTPPSLLTISFKAKRRPRKTALFTRMGEVTADDGSTLTVATFAGAPSLTVDAVIVPMLAILPISGFAAMPVHYLLEAYKHLKPIALAGDARRFKGAFKH